MNERRITKADLDAAWAAYRASKALGDLSRCDYLEQAYKRQQDRDASAPSAASVAMVKQVVAYLEAQPDIRAAVQSALAAKKAQGHP